MDIRRTSIIANENPAKFHEELSNTVRHMQASSMSVTIEYQMSAHPNGETAVHSALVIGRSDS